MPEKAKFLAGSAMTFAQILATASLATRLFAELSVGWRACLVVAMFILVITAALLFPNEAREED